MTPFERELLTIVADARAQSEQAMEVAHAFTNDQTIQQAMIAQGILSGVSAVLGIYVATKNMGNEKIEVQVVA